MDKLIKEINVKLHAVKGGFSVAYFNLHDGTQFLINGDSVFHAASTMKVPVMIEVFNQAKNGALSLTDSLPVVNNFRSIVDGSSYQLSAGDDSDSGLYQKVGDKMTVYDLMYRMIIYSSNLATNIIIDRVGASNVMKTIAAAGASHMQVLRGVEDQKAYDAGLNNTTTARDLMILFREIGNLRMVSAEASKAMIRILEDQRHNEIIPALLPASVRVAHKTGNISGVEHDAGIIFAPDGTAYVLVILSKNLEDRQQAVRMMAEVSRLIFDAVAARDTKKP